MKKETLVFQQGDTLYFASTIPDGALDLKTPIVQHGEATGHAHRLSGDGWEHLEHKPTKTRYLRVVTPTDLTHEEHHTITLAPGDYLIGIVREYNHFEEEARQVAD